jgi:hypothetical protein
MVEAMFRTAIVCFLLVASASAADVLDLLRNMDLEAAPHRYYEQRTNDRFAKLRTEIEAGRIALDRSGEKAFLLSLLKALEIPASSQMLVLSTTSLQLSLISPSNPRALYFNEDTYLGFVPGGRIEIISIDPELGGIFYIFDVPKKEGPLAVERSRRCMNCHSGSESGYVPGLVIKSVVPGRRGGSIDAFRVDMTGHGIPLSDRFGGWYLTGNHGFTNHWANAIGRTGPDQSIEKDLLIPGERFSYSKYPVATSDILPQLVHEHQAGFVNRVLQAGYAARTMLHENAAETTDIQRKLEPYLQEIAKYIFFADEARLPEGGLQVDAAFAEDFRKSGRVNKSGASLKDFDLKSRMFRHRCSYMIYSPLLESLPDVAKKELFRILKKALLTGDASSAHIPAEEKAAIRSILRETHPEFRDL